MRRKLTVALLAIVALLVSACSGVGGDLSAGTYGSDEGEAEGLRSIRVADTAGMPAAFLQYGIQRGFFEQEGLSVDLQSSGGGTAVVPALINGELDVAGTSAVGAMVAMGRGLNMRMIAAGTSSAEAPEKDFSGMLVAPGSGIERITGIAGRRVAVNALHSVADVIIRSILHRAGTDASTVEFVEMPFPDMVPALQRGDVDAAFLIEPFSTIGRAQGLQDIGGPYTTLHPGMQVGTFIMMEDRANEDPDLVAAFRRGVARTAESVANDPASFREALPRLGNFEPELARQIRLPVWRVRTDRESLRLYQETMLRTGLLEEPLDFDRFVLH